MNDLGIIVEYIGLPDDEECMKGIHKKEKVYEEMGLNEAKSLNSSYRKAFNVQNSIMVNMDAIEVSGKYLEKVITSSVFLSTFSKAISKSISEECNTSFAVMVSRQSLDQIFCTPIVCEEGIKYRDDDIESIGRIPAYEIFDNKQLLVSLNLNYDELNNLGLFCIDNILNVGQIGLYGLPQK